MHLATVSRPVIGDHDLLVKVNVASLNPLDFKRRDGALKQIMPDTFPFILGNDLSGVVEAVGKDVTKFKVGDAVYGRIGRESYPWGTLAEYCPIHEDHAALKPESMPFEIAAAFPLVGLTAMQAFRRAGFTEKSYKSCLIPAGAGGVGMLAVQLAKHMFNAERIVSTASASKIDFVMSLGATQVIDYTTSDPVTVLAGAQVVDFVFDTTGDAVKLMEIIRPGGFCCSIATLPDRVEVTKSIGADPGFVVGHYLDHASHKITAAATKHQIEYSYLFMNPSGADLQQIGALVEAGLLKVHLDTPQGTDGKPYTLETFGPAFAHMESGRSKGKIVMNIGGY